MLKNIAPLLERLKSFFANFSKRRPPAVPVIPGETSTQIGGKRAKPAVPLIDWEKLYRKSFVYNSIAAAIIGYFVADLLVAGMTPWFPQAEAPRPRLNLQSERKDFISYSDSIMPKGRPNLFNEKGLVPDNDEGGGDLNGPPVKTSLPLTLMGVIVVQDMKKSVASIEDKGQNQVIAVRVNEPITRDTLVQSISEERVVFINHATNRREFVELPPDASNLKVHNAAPVSAADGITHEGGGHVSISRDAMKTALGADFGKILTQALCKPEMDNGKPIGYRCTEIEKGSVYEKLGLQNGDVVTMMDGDALTNMGPLMQKLNDLREGRIQHLSITYIRNGQPNTTYFNLE
jgi:type II secretion system protein C